MAGRGPDVDTRDLDEARFRLSDVYCPHRLTLTRRGDGFTCRQTAWGDGPVRVFDLCYGGAEVRVDPVPFDDFVLVTRPIEGRFGVRSASDGLVVTRDRALVMDAYGSYQLRWLDSCRVLNVVLDRRRVEKAAAEMRGFDEPRPLRFDVAEPGSDAAWRRWASVSRFLLDHVRSPVDEGASLLRAELLRLAVAALLDAYPTHHPEPSATPASSSPAAVRRARSYIELHAHEDIGPSEIAAAARLSVRGLQAAFRRSEETTPLAYLRRTRLRRAHADLVRQTPDDTTVAAVAGRWGFSNLSRFAAEHRAEYGCSPSDTLRRD